MSIKMMNAKQTATMRELCDKLWDQINDVPEVEGMHPMEVRMYALCVAITAGILMASGDRMRVLEIVLNQIRDTTETNIKIDDAIAKSASRH